MVEEVYKQVFLNASFRRCKRREERERERKRERERE